MITDSSKTVISAANIGSLEAKSVGHPSQVFAGDSPTQPTYVWIGFSMIYLQ